MNMHNYPLWRKVIKLYKKAKNRKKKFLDEVTTALIYSYKGGVGVFLLKLLHFVSVYIVKTGVKQYFCNYFKLSVYIYKKFM